MKKYGVEMKEKIIHIEVSKRKEKKYMAIVVDFKTKKERRIHFGALSYQQFRDSTKLGKFSSKDHGDKERKKKYYLRHSGVELKKDAIKKELKKSKGRYNAKILSHMYLW